VYADAALSGPTIADAQRECRSAFADEFEARSTRVSTPSILVTVTEIEIEDSRAVDGGFEVNGVVKYVMTTAYVGSVPSSLRLSCHVKVDGEKLSTVVG